MSKAPLIKICGMTDKENLLEVVSLKPHMLGFIFYKSSPRNVEEKIVNLPLHDIPSSIKKVAVMVNKPLREALEITTRWNFDMVQLHGAESPGYCMEMKNHIPVIKAFAIKDELPENLEKYTHSTDYFLFDTKSDKPGGSGKQFDHGVLSHYDLPNPFFLSGGIGPDFGSAADQFAHPRWWAVDINSRFESSPGIKNISILKKFMQHELFQ